MENPIGRFARLPDGTKVVIEEMDGAIAVTRRVEGPNEGIPAFIELAKLEMLDGD